MTNYKSKYKIYDKSAVNKCLDSKLQECLDVAFQYQQSNNITGECITNSILFANICKALGERDYTPITVLSVGGYDLGERYTPHVVNYNRCTATILDASYVNWWEIEERDFYYTFPINRVLREAVGKNIISAEERFNIYNDFFGLDESVDLHPAELDCGKRMYYNELLDHIESTVDCDELKNVTRPVKAETVEYYFAEEVWA